MVKIPYQYWKLDGEEWILLQDMAKKPFTMGTSSAALEINFYIVGFIHTKLRNRLSTVSVENMVYVNTNMGMFCNFFMTIHTLKSNMR